MEKYPNIKVECEYGAWDGWAEKVATQLSGGTAPDGCISSLATVLNS